MADPFLAEIRIFAGGFAPNQWALCNGQIMAISQNTALFSIIGTYYGGNGVSNFGLPNFQDSVPVGQGQGPGLTQRDIGEVGGDPFVTLTITEMAPHNHAFGGSGNQGDKQLPAPGLVLAQSSPGQAYQTNATANLKPMAPNMLAPTGGSLPHNNVMPTLGANFIIALQGIFPNRG